MNKTYVPPATAAAWLEEMSAPEGDFKWGDSEPEWYPVWDRHWSLVATSVDIERINGKLVIEVREGDTDGNWDLVGSYDETEGDTVEHWLSLYADYLSPDAMKERMDSWPDYFQHVVETGEDPLHEFNVKREREVEETWLFNFNRTLGGVAVVAAKHAGKLQDVGTLPMHVQQFLGSKPNRSASYIEFDPGETFEQWKARVDAHDDLNQNFRCGVWWKAKIKRKVARPANAVAKELRTAARRALKRS